MKKILDSYFKFIRRLIPKKATAPSVGVDIGSEEITLVQIEHKENNFELVRWDVESIEDGDMEAALKNILGRLDAPPKQIYSSIFGKGTLIRYVQFPRMSENELANSFQLEADKYFPFAQDQIYTDSCILDPSSKSKKMTVLAAAAKCEMIDERVELLSKLELETNFIGVGSVALMNVVNTLGFNDMEEEDAVVAVFDLGDSVTHLSVLINGVPWFTRDVYIGAKELRTQIKNALGVTDAEAKALMLQPGEKREKVFEACESVIMNILQEVKLSFEYFSSEKGKSITHFFITGEIALLDGVEDVFAKDLNVKTHLWNPLEKLVIAQEMPQEELKQKCYKLGTALGLALYDYD